MKVDRELTARMARELLPRRVLVLQSIVSLTNYLEERRTEPTKSYIAQVQGPNLVEAKQLMIDDRSSVEFWFETGYRLVESESHKNEEDEPETGASNSSADLQGGENSDDIQSALILLTMRLIMLKTEEKDYEEKDLIEFGKTSGAFQIWPYFREFVHSSFVRAGLETPPVSMFTLSR